MFAFIDRDKLVTEPADKVAPETKPRRGRKASLGAVLCLAAAATLASVHWSAADDWPAEFPLSGLNGETGFRMQGDYGDHVGRSIASAGDVNGDGYGDVIVSAPGYYDRKRRTHGAAFVVFGHGRKFDPVLRLPKIRSREGFIIVSQRAQISTLGVEVAGAGDVNRDGFDDMLVSASSGAITGVPSNAGVTYVIFGSGGAGRTVVVESLDGRNGFRIVGAGANNLSGTSLAAVGDVNADGFDDIVVGAPSATTGRRKRPGAVYVIFGKKRGFLASYDLRNLDPSDGFRVTGRSTGDRFGASVSGLGDFNADGYSDFVVGAPEAKVGAAPDAGAAYVIFGRRQFGRSFSVADLDGKKGLRIEGAARQNRTGTSVSAADVNCDGYSDVIVGAPFAETDARLSEAGATFVVFGRRRSEQRVALAKLGGDDGFRIDGGIFEEQSGASLGAGDIDADGCGDIIIGAPRDAGFSGIVGSAYAVFGHKKAFANPMQLSSLKGRAGFRLKGSGSFSDTGRSVAMAGDLNGDGFADMLVGAPDFAVDDQYGAGIVYVVFGH